MTNQHTEACGCVVTAEPGHVHTKLCDAHKREIFDPGQIEPDNLDLVGG